MADTMNFGPEWLRTLSSGGGNTKSPSGAKTGGTAEPGGTHHHSPLKHSQSYNSFVSPPKQLPTPTAPSGKKFPLATHRYGKEELLLLFSEDTGRPDDVPNLSPLTKLRLAMPLSFMPLTEEEQVALSGGMNSETVYGGGRGRGGYYRGRGRGRGRGEYHRSSSYSGDDYGGGGGGGVGSGVVGEGGRGGGYYYRGGGRGGGGVAGGGGEIDVWNPEGRGRGGASRALRDGNWRSSTTPDDEPAPGWGNQRQQQPLPSPATGVPPRNAWGKKDPAATPTGQTGQTGSGRWGHPASLPEWARDDMMTTTSVGTFDSTGTFTSSGEKSRAAVVDDSKPASSQSTNKQSVEGETSVVDNQSTRQQKQLKTTAQNESHATTNREGLVLKMSDEHLVASPHPSPLTDSSSHRPHPHKSHSLGSHPVAASVFPLATHPLPLSSSSAMSSRHVVRPLTLSAVSLPPPVTSATPAETPPSVIGPTAHLASGDVVMSRDNHVISHGVSHDRGKERLFSPHLVEDDQMRRIEKATEALLYTEEEMTPSPGPIPQPPPPTTSSVLTPSSAHATPSPAAPPQKPTPPSSSSSLPGPTSTSVGPEELNKWFYKDPQGETQGPFPATDMREWFNAGYFTMELMIKRSCDALMLPLGQMIRIWGRIPFQPTSHAPPPIRPEEPFWQRLFQQQFILQQQMQHKQQQQQQQQQMQQQELLQQQQRRVNQQPLPAAAKEEQWPDITGGESLWETPLTRPPPPSSSVITANTQLIQQQKKPEEKVRRIEEEREEKMRRESEERKRAEEERQRQVAAELARKQRDEEEAKKRVLEQERERQEQMKREQQERVRQEQLRREEEERARKEQLRAELTRQQEKMRKEQERARLEQMRREEEKKKAEEQEKLRLAKEQQRKHEMYLQQQQQQQQQQQLIEQQQELQRKQQMEHQQRQLRLQREQDVQRSTQQQLGSLPWVPQTTPTSQQAPSLLQIQQEEESQAKEMRNREEQMRTQHMKLFQQPQQPQPQLGWGKSSIKKPKSLVEIQQEQQTDPQELTTPTSASGHGLKGKSYFTFGTPSSLNPPPNVQNWSSLAGKKAPPTSWGGGQPHPHDEVAMTSSNQKGGNRPQFKIADGELDEVSFWDDCAREVKNSRSHGNQSGSHGNQSGSHGNQSGPSWGEGAAPKKKDREEENIRRLFSVNSATEEFNQWCERELKKFSTDVDAQTFISFLLEVDSVYEVHDYIKSYLGETDEAHEFAKSFLDRRQKIKSTNNLPPASQGKKSRPKNNSSAHAELSPADPIKMGGASGVGGVASSSSEGSGGGGGTSRSSKKKKKKMQKVNPAALLGFTVNAGERPNMGGEIQSAKDAV